MGVSPAVDVLRSVSEELLLGVRALTSGLLYSRVALLVLTIHARVAQALRESFFIAFSDCAVRALREVRRV